MGVALASQLALGASFFSKSHMQAALMTPTLPALVLCLTKAPGASCRPGLGVDISVSEKAAEAKVVEVLAQSMTELLYSNL
jgi:hypothetical protein